MSGLGLIGEGDIKPCLGFIITESDCFLRKYNCSTRELGAYGITVNMVSGGLLRTTDASSATSQEVFDLIESTTPLRKVTTPEDLADVVLFFASPWARAVTGQNLIVDGGLVMN